MIDDTSRYCYVYSLKIKDDTLDCSLAWLMPCWTLLDYLRHDRGGLTLLNSYHILNRVPMKNKENTTDEKWIRRKPSLSYLHT
jgi:hypothetical protein